MTQVTARFERIKARPAYEMVAEEIERQNPVRHSAARRSDRNRVRAGQAVRRQPLHRAGRHPAPGAVRPGRAGGEPAPVCFRAALPRPRHAHEPRAHPAAGYLPRALSHLPRPRAGVDRSGHGQPDRGRPGGFGGQSRPHARDAARCACGGRARCRVSQTAGHRHAQPRAAARQGAREHPGPADNRLHHHQQPRRDSAADRGAHAYR